VYLSAIKELVTDSRVKTRTLIIRNVLQTLHSVQEDTEADNGLFPIIKKQTANHRIRRTNVAGYVSLCTCTQQCHA